MNSKVLLMMMIIIIIGLGSSSVLMAQNYQVNGAGSTFLNGIYLPIGPHPISGITYYQFGGYYLYRELYAGTNYWNIDNDLDDLNDVYYYSESDATTPPSGGWDNEFGTGANPVPTVSETSLPVFMEQLSAVPEKNGVLISWTTESEVDNAGFILERRVGDDEIWQVIASYETMATLRGQGTTSNATEYEYFDPNIQTGQSIQYRLSDVDLNGNITVDGIVTVTAEEDCPSGPPEETDLKTVSPNPFNPTTSIHYDLSEITVVSLIVFDLRGRLVQTLISNQSQYAGSYIQYWSGRNDLGQNVPSGTYILHLRTDSFSKSQKMILIR